MSFVTDASGHRSVAFWPMKRAPVVRSATSAASTASAGGAPAPTRENTEFATGPCGATETVLAFGVTAGAAAILPLPHRRSHFDRPNRLTEGAGGSARARGTRGRIMVAKESAGRTNCGTAPAKTSSAAPEFPIATEYRRGYMMREISAMATIAHANSYFSGIILYHTVAVPLFHRLVRRPALRLGCSESFGRASAETASNTFKSSWNFEKSGRSSFCCIPKCFIASKVRRYKNPAACSGSAEPLDEAADHEAPQDHGRVHAAQIFDARARDRTEIRDDRRAFPGSPA